MVQFAHVILTDATHFHRKDKGRSQKGTCYIRKCLF